MLPNSILETIKSSVCIVGCLFLHLFILAGCDATRKFFNQCSLPVLLPKLQKLKNTKMNPLIPRAFLLLFIPLKISFFQRQNYCQLDSSICSGRRCIHCVCAAGKTKLTRTACTIWDKTSCSSRTASTAKTGIGNLCKDSRSSRDFFRYFSQDKRNRLKVAVKMPEHVCHESESSLEKLMGTRIKRLPFLSIRS